MQKPNDAFTQPLVKLQRPLFGETHALPVPSLCSLNLQFSLVTSCFFVPVRRRSMRRKGWSTVQVPDGWLQIIRGPRLQSKKWPVRGRQSSKPPAKGRRGSQVGLHPEASRRGPLQEELVSIARARVMNMEAAMAAVGESDPAFSHLQEALKKAKAQCQVRLVQDRIASSKDFIERAKKMIVDCEAEVSQAKEVLAKVQSKLQQEEQGLVDGEARKGHSFWSLQRQVREPRKFLRRFLAISPTNWPNCELVCLSCGEGNRIYVCSCSQVEGQRTRTQTAKKSDKFHSRFGTVEPCTRRPRWSWGRSQHAFDDRRRFSQNGDSDRQFGSKLAFESIQSSVWVIRQARYGLRGGSGRRSIKPRSWWCVRVRGPDTGRFCCNCARIWSCAFQPHSERCSH